MEEKVEYDAKCEAYFAIDVEKLLKALSEVAEHPIFQDSYGEGVAQYNGVSYMSYASLAAAIGVDLDEYRGPASDEQISECEGF
jgi:hypothetical protein